MVLEKLIGLLSEQLSAPGCAAGAAGLLGLWLSDVNERPSRQAVRVWVLCAAAFGLLAAFAPHQEMESVSALRQSALDGVHEMRYGRDLLPEGRLDRAGKLHEGGVYPASLHE